MAELEAIYAAGVGRPSIPPERLLRALLLQAFYGIRSERQNMERLEHDLLFRWFAGLGVDDAAWDQTTFGKNRDRLLAGDVAHKFLAAVPAHPTRPDLPPRRPGRVVDLAAWSTAVDRRLKEALQAGALTNLAGGL